MSQRTLIRCLEQTSQSSVGGVKRKGTMQGNARPMSLVKHHGRGGRECRKANLHPTPHADKDPRSNLHPKPHPHLSLQHHLSPHQLICLILWPHPTRQQAHSHQVRLHGHNIQLSSTLQTSSTQLGELLSSLQANQHHTPMQKHRTLKHYHHRYCSFMFDVLFINM